MLNIFVETVQIYRPGYKKKKQKQKDIHSIQHPTQKVQLQANFIFYQSFRHLPNP